MHHIVNMPVLLHLVVIVHHLFILVHRFIADRNDELMRATTSSPAVFIANVFQASIPPCYLVYSFASIYYDGHVLRCFSCLDPISIYLAANNFAYLPHRITMFCL
jgi:hypothetical protein